MLGHVDEELQHILGTRMLLLCRHLELEVMFMSHKSTMF